MEVVGLGKIQVTYVTLSLKKKNECHPMKVERSKEHMESFSQENKRKTRNWACWP